MICTHTHTWNMAFYSLFEYIIVQLLVSSARHIIISFLFHVYAKCMMWSTRVWNTMQRCIWTLIAMFSLIVLGDARKLSCQTHIKFRLKIIFFSLHFIQMHFNENEWTSMQLLFTSQFDLKQIYLNHVYLFSYYFLFLF